jgi:predicted dehydrogenase
VMSVRAHALNQEHVELELELERGQATVICSCNSPYRELVQVRSSDGRAVGTFKRGGILAGIIGKLLPRRENPLVNSLAGQLEAFRCAVRGVPSAQPLSSVVDGVKVMSIIEAVRSSAQSGCSRRSVLERCQAD